MLIDEIIKESKKQETHIFFDMDGTLAEYKSSPKIERYTPGSNYYSNPRPMNYFIKIAKRLSKQKNVEVHILSNCPLNEQIEQKKNWLKRYMPFIKMENVHIICYENITFNKEDKAKLKGQFLENNFKDKKCYLIEDDLRNIKAANELLGKNVAFHISMFIA